MRRHTGFTLVELAIVLVIIGLIMGMAFKGRDLIDGAKVKNAQAQYNKFSAAFNIYQEKYGSYPGDGWTADPATAVTGATGTRNGIIDGEIEPAAALAVLQNAGMLSGADLRSAFGGDWSISDETGGGNFAAGVNYLTVDAIDSNAVDARFVCQLDRVTDDGLPDAGFVRSSASNGATASSDYDATVDCWSRSGQVSLGMRVLP